MRCDEPVAIHLPGTVEAGWAGFLVRPRDYPALIVQRKTLRPERPQNRASLYYVPKGT